MGKRRFEDCYKEQDNIIKEMDLRKVEVKDKSFDFVIKTPPAAVQLLEATKIKKGSGEPNREKVASVSWDQIKKIAEDKMVDLNAFTVDSAMRMVAGTARSMGIKVNGEQPPVSK